MCVYSMIIDYFEPIIPYPQPSRTWPPQPQIWPQPIASEPFTPEQFRQLEKIVDEFKKAVDAAKVVDNLTGQKDCVDPEKEKLLARVAELEKQIAEMKTRKKPKKKIASKDSRRAK